MGEWTINQPTTIDIDEPVSSLDVRVVSGHVDVVTTDGPARVEVTEIDTAPLVVQVSDGRLTIAHEDLRWSGVLGWLRMPRERRRAVVSVAVPPDATASVGVVSADAVVAGLDAGVKVRGVSGDIVIDRTAGDVQVESVSGDVEARGVGGDVSLKTVSGSLTVVDGTPSKVRARSISGDVILDVRSSHPLNIDVNTVSGDVTVRMPEGPGLKVDVLSTSGDLACGFDQVHVETFPGKHRLSGRVGAGEGDFRGRTVSGNVALLQRDSA